MAVVAGVENGLVGAAALAAPQRLTSADFTITAPGGGGSLFPLAPTVTLTGSILAGGDEDYYAFTAVAGQVVLCDIDGTTNGLDSRLVIFVPPVPTPTIAGLDTITFDTGSSTLADPRTLSNINVSGEWVVMVRAENTAMSGAYTLHISIMNAPILFYGTVANDTAVGESGADTLAGFALGTAATEVGADVLVGGIGGDLLLGGGGGDSLFGEEDADTLDGGAGDDYLDGGVSNDLLTGGAGNDWLDAGSGADTADGGDGADTLVGYLGADRLLGGAGNDVMRGDDAAYQFGSHGDTLRGEAGNDLLEGGFDRDRLEGGAGDDTLVGDTAGQAGGANAGRDVLVGGAGADSLSGGGDDDNLSGGSGADTAEGGDGADRISGGDGNDLLFDSLALLSPTAPDGSRDSLDGGAGADTLRGGWGDRMLGGEGDDQVEFWSTNLGTAPRLANLLDGGSGTDTLVVRSYTDGNMRSMSLDQVFGGVVRLTFGIGTTMENAAPLAFSALGFERFLVLGTSSAADWLEGGAGADTLMGGGGGNGGPGDVILGGAGDDVLTTHADPDQNPAQLGPNWNVSLLGGAGNDRITISGNSTTGIADGGDGDDLIVVNVGAFDLILQGGAGADTIMDRDGGVRLADGGSGDDLLIITRDPVWAGLPLVLENYGEGDGVAFWGGVQFDFTGFERLSIRGEASADWLQGGDGADTLDGGAGADTLAGGLGNDLLVVDAAGDQISDTGGADTVASSVNWRLGAGFEALVLTGDGLLRGDGNSAANRLVGNAGANTLSGSGGADTLDGGAGSDYLYGGAGNDIFILRQGFAANDAVLDFAGNGAASGDRLRVEDYGTGVTVTLVVGGIWRIQGSLGTDTIIIGGAFDPLFDVIFA